jgi:ABC-type enterochelin transport system permease subunit
MSTNRMVILHKTNLPRIISSDMVGVVFPTATAIFNEVVRRRFSQPTWALLPATAWL